jgi:hypothetical protein
VNNDGVAENERMNHYRFQEVAPSRAGGEEVSPTGERRALERRATRLRALVSQETGAADQPGSCLELSAAGARLRVRLEQRTGSAVAVTLLSRSDSLEEAQPLITLKGQAIWCEPIGPQGPSRRYDLGLQFDALSPGEEETLNLILDGRVPGVGSAGAPARK